MSMRFWITTIAAASLVSFAATLPTAVTSADVLQMKAKVAAGETLSAADRDLIQRINATTTSKIRIPATGHPTGQQPSHHGHGGALDELYGSEVPYQWVDISALGSTAHLSGDDDMSSPLYLGFSFPYFGVSRDSVRICTNGFLSFVDQWPEYNNVPIPDPELPNDAIYGFWDDLYVTDSTGIRCYADTDSQRFITSYHVRKLSDPDSAGYFFNFQIILYATGKARVNFQTVPPDVYSCTVGFENAAGDSGYAVCAEGIGLTPRAGMSLVLGDLFGVPLPVSNLAGVAGATDIVLSWTDPVLDINGDPVTISEVQVWFGNVGTGQLLGTVNHGVQTFTHASAPSGNNQYTLRPKAGNYYGTPRDTYVVIGTPGFRSDFEATGSGFLAEPTNGFEWGVPTDPLGPTAHSGTQVWGTVLAGNYAEMACYHLTLDAALPVLTANASFEFFYWQNAQVCCDGWNLKASVDNGQTWTVLTPASGYSAGTLWMPCVENEPALRMVTNGWRYIRFPIGAYIGQSPMFRIDFADDGWETGPGLFIDDLMIWGVQPPTYSRVSGTVALDGHNGSVSQARIHVNGLHAATVNADVIGEFAFDTVQVGQRQMTVTLPGYHSLSTTVPVPETGLTGVLLTVRRLNPPPPEALATSVDSSNGVVTLTWDDTADSTADRYHIFRKLRTDVSWAAVNPATHSPATDTLPAAGVYLYRITAVDTNVAPPAVESDPSMVATAIYGQMRPTSLTGSGNFDDEIHLAWLAPGLLPSIELAYDDGTADGWTRPNWWSAGPSDFHALRFTPPAATDAEYPLPLTACYLYFDTTVALPYIAVCPDSGGVPMLSSPLHVWTDRASSTSPGWLVINTQGDVVLANDNDFWVVWQYPAGEAHPAIGMNFDVNPGRSFWSTTPGEWFQDWGNYLCHVWVGGEPPVFDRGLASATQGPPRLHVNRAPELEKAHALALRAGYTRSAKAGPVRQSLPSTSTKALRTQAGWTTAPRHGNGALDEVTNYRVYRNGTLHAQIPGTETVYTDTSVVENQNYTYDVRAYYDNTTESAATPPVTLMCNMAPGQPLNIQAIPVGITQMRITWDDPVVNADGTTLTDLAGVRIYRDANLLATVNPGVEQYLDTPPSNTEFYTWRLEAVDEVPNAIEGAYVTAAIISPWVVVDYEWIDISQTGTNTGIVEDDNNAVFPLGFDFEFYGQTYTQVRISANGWVSFSANSEVSGFFNEMVPFSEDPNAAIFVFWDDLWIDASSESVMYLADAAHHRFIVSWHAERLEGSNDFEFQLILDHQGGITMQYQTLPDDISSYTSGVEDSTGTVGIQLWYDGSGMHEVAPETAVKFWGGPIGTVCGLVRSSLTNVPLANCRVWATDVEASDTATTTANGSYCLDIVPGLHTLAFERTGNCRQLVSGVVVANDSTTTTNAFLSAPSMQMSLSSISMETAPGFDAQTRFYIYNRTGHCPLEITAVDSVEWLSASPDTGTVAVGDSLLVTVTALVADQPLGTELNGTLYFESNVSALPASVEVMVVMGTTNVNEPGSIPTAFALQANYPNPFNATTSLRFDVPTASRVDITVFNVMGQEVAKPVSDVYAAGRYRVGFDAGNLPSGMYLVRMNAGSFSAINKMMLLK